MHEDDALTCTLYVDIIYLFLDISTFMRLRAATLFTL
jgi:hypothetical protein